MTNSNSNEVIAVEVGKHYILGYSGDSYGIWEKISGDQPGQLFASVLMTPDNWQSIWTQFKSWESARDEMVANNQNLPGKFSANANDQASEDVRLPGMSRAPKFAPGSSWSANSNERVVGLTDNYGRPNPVIVKSGKSSGSFKVKKRLQMSAYVSFTLALIEIGIRLYLFIESRKSIDLRISGHAYFVLQVATYVVGVMAFWIGLSARKRILQSDNRRAGFAIAWFGIMVGWIVVLVSLGLDIYPQIHHAVTNSS